MRRSPILVLLPLVLAMPACVGTTGDQVLDFEAVASGPTDAAPGEPLSFPGSRGWQVTLTTARLHVGALYLAESMPVSGAQASSCHLTGQLRRASRAGAGRSTCCRASRNPSPCSAAAARSKRAPGKFGSPAVT